MLYDYKISFSCLSESINRVFVPFSLVKLIFSSDRGIIEILINF